MTHAEMAALHEFQSYLATQAELPYAGKTGISDAFPYPDELTPLGDDADKEAKDAHKAAKKDRDAKVKAVDAKRAACRSGRDELAQIRAKEAGA